MITIYFFDDRPTEVVNSEGIENMTDKINYLTTADKVNFVTVDPNVDLSKCFRCHVPMEDETPLPGHDKRMFCPKCGIGFDACQG